MTTAPTLDRIKDSRLDMAVKLLCIALCFAMFLIAATVYRADVTGIIIFALFIVFYIQLPGQLILKALKFKALHISTTLSVGLFTGWAFMVMQYFLTDLIGTDVLLYVLSPLLSLIYIAFAIKERRSRGGRSLGEVFTKVPAGYFMFTVLALAYSMLETQFRYLSPTVDQETYVKIDNAFHMGLTNALSQGWPLESPWFSGTYYNYHIFSELLMSVPVRLFGLTSDCIILSCGPYFTVFAFGISLYAFLREMIKRKEQAGLWCLAIILSNIFIAKDIISSSALEHILKNTNVAGYAMGCTFAFMIVLKYWYDSIGDGGFHGLGRRSFGYYVLIVALIMLLTGIKGPFGLVILAGLWGTLVLGIIMRKLSFRLVIPFVVVAAAFLLIYVVILGSKGQSGVGESPIGIANILGITFFKKPLVLWMKAHGLPIIARYLVLLFTFTAFMLTAFFLPCLIGYIRELVLVLAGKKEFDFPRIVVYAAFLVGFIAMMILRFNGHSQIYFGFITVFFAPVIAIWFFEDMEQNRGFLMTTIRVIFLVCLALCAVSLFAKNFEQVEEAKAFADPAKVESTYRSVTHDEYEAMRWLDENTPEDSLLATDRYYSVSLPKYDVSNRWDNCFFLYPVYSNRTSYLGGSGFTLPNADWPKRAERARDYIHIYDKDDPKRDDLVKELGIDYVVVSKRFTDAGDLSDDVYKLCYSNDDIDVYEIK